ASAAHSKKARPKRRLELVHRVLPFKALTVGHKDALDAELGSALEQSLNARAHRGPIFDSGGKEPATRKLSVGPAHAEEKSRQKSARLSDMKHQIRQDERATLQMEDGPLADARRAFEGDPFERGAEIARPLARSDLFKREVSSA